MNQPVIKTVSNVADRELEQVCARLQEEGYLPVQKRKEVLWDAKKKKEVTLWTVKAKLNGPQQKPNRHLED